MKLQNKLAHGFSKKIKPFIPFWTGYNICHLCYQTLKEHWHDYDTVRFIPLGIPLFHVFI